MTSMPRILPILVQPTYIVLPNLANIWCEKLYPYRLGIGDLFFGEWWTRHVQMFFFACICICREWSILQLYLTHKLNWCVPFSFAIEVGPKSYVQIRIRKVVDHVTGIRIRQQQIRSKQMYSWPHSNDLDNVVPGNSFEGVSVIFICFSWKCITTKTQW